MLTELTTIRSDDRYDKRKITNEIISNGSTKMPDSVKRGSTTHLLRIFINGMALQMN